MELLKVLAEALVVGAGAEEVVVEGWVVVVEAPRPLKRLVVGAAVVAAVGAALDALVVLPRFANILEAGAAAVVLGPVVAALVVDPRLPPRLANMLDAGAAAVVLGAADAALDEEPRFANILLVGGDTAVAGAEADLVVSAAFALAKLANGDAATPVKRFWVPAGPLVAPELPPAPPPRLLNIFGAAPALVVAVEPPPPRFANMFEDAAAVVVAGCEVAGEAAAPPPRLLKKFGAAAGLAAGVCEVGPPPPMLNCNLLDVAGGEALTPVVPRVKALGAAELGCWPWAPPVAGLLKKPPEPAVDGVVGLLAFPNRLCGALFDVVLPKRLGDAVDVVAGVLPNGFAGAADARGCCPDA